MGEASKDRGRDIILGVYRSQLKKFRELSVYDDEGNFLFGKYTEFGTKVTEGLIKITEKRLFELVNAKLSRKGILRYENQSNGQAGKKV